MQVSRSWLILEFVKTEAYKNDHSDRAETPTLWWGTGGVIRDITHWIRDITHWPTTDSPRSAHGTCPQWTIVDYSGVRWGTGVMGLRFNTHASRAQAQSPSPCSGTSVVSGCLQHTKPPACPAALPCPSGQVMLSSWHLVPLQSSWPSPACTQPFEHSAWRLAHCAGLLPSPALAAACRGLSRLPH
jgi:hypothetical protein